MHPPNLRLLCSPAKHHFTRALLHSPLPPLRSLKVPPVNLTKQLLILDHRAGPIIRDPALFVLVPGAAVGVCEAAGLEDGLDLGVESGGARGRGHQADGVVLGAGVEDGGDEGGEVAGLGFDHEDDAVVAEVGVGAVEPAVYVSM